MEIPQARSEAVEGALGVGAGAVEAAIDDALHPGAERLGERDARERRDRHRDLGSARERAERRLKQDDAREERHRDAHGRRAVHERAIDEDVDVVEAVAEDSDPDHHRREGYRALNAGSFHDWTAAGWPVTAPASRR